MKNSLKKRCLFACSSLSSKVVMLLFMVLIPLSSFGQNKTITGKVTDNTGESLIGVNVVVEGAGTLIGTTTDFDGNYSLSVPGDKKSLKFTYLGYQTQSVSINNRTKIDVKLAEDTKTLEEVVVTAMGIERQAKTLTYATQTVGGKELTRAKDVNFVNSLQGKTAGMVITPNSSGAGGGASKIILRGQSSILGNNQPLIVLDGIPLSNGMSGQTQDGILYGSAKDGGDALSMINPDDIANVTVLKGANAAALYGSAANNGVLIITTKNGRDGKVRVDFSSNTTAEMITIVPDFQTTYGGRISETGSNMEFNGWGPRISQITDDELARVVYATRTPNDKVSDLFQPGYTFNNTISLNGGTEAVQSYFSYGNTYQQGVMFNNTFLRHNLMFKQSYNLFNKKLTADVSINYINQTLKNRPVFGKALSPVLGLYRAPANIDMRYFKENYQRIATTEDEIVSDKATGNRKLIGHGIQNWYFYDQYINNPYFLMNKMADEGIKNRILSSFALRYKIIPGLTAQARFSLDMNLDRGTNQEYATINRSALSNGGSYGGSRNHSRQLFSDYLLTFEHKFGRHIDFNATVGTSFRRSNWNSFSMNNTIDTAAAPNVFLPQNNKYRDIQSSLSGQESWGTGWEAAVFATAQIGFWEMAYVDFSIRNDWAKAFQQFSKDGKYIGYPYFSVGGNVLLKEMFPSVFGKFDALKMRVSYSEVGNSIPDQVFAGQGFDFSSGAVTARPPGFDDPKPETTKAFEAGVNGAILNNKLDFDLTYYQSIMENQFMYIPTSTGQSKPINAGRIRNQGVEFSANYNMRFNRNFSWTTGVNLAYNDNKILSTYTFPDGTKQETRLGVPGFQVRYIEGGSYGDIYVKSFLRDDNGKIQLNNDGSPRFQTEYDTYGGNTTAPFSFGWNNTFNYKNFQLYVLIDGKIGGKVLSITESDLDFYGLSKRVGDLRDAAPVVWKPEPTETDPSAGRYTQYMNLPDGQPVEIRKYYEAIGYQNAFESYIYDATNIRIREVSLGYTFENLFGQTKGLSLSLVARNIGFIYRNAPVDPDISSTAANGFGGIDVYALPVSRNIGLNIKATF